MNARELAEAVEKLQSDDEARDLLAIVLRDDAERLLSEIARDRSPGVRGWALWAATSALGDKAVPILRGRLRDRDPDVRDDALSKLLVVDPSAVRSELPRIRKKLNASDAYEVASAIWALAELRDRGALERIRQLAATPPTPWLVKPASVAILLIEGREEEVMTAIRDHDHYRMKELAHGAALIGGQSALQSLRQGSEAQTDDECRAWCSWFSDWALRRSQSAPGPAPGPAGTAHN
jgi:hypothetical protein